MVGRLESLGDIAVPEVVRLAPLVDRRGGVGRVPERHMQRGAVRRVDLAGLRGRGLFGIDAGSPRSRPRSSEKRRLCGPPMREQGRCAALRQGGRRRYVPRVAPRAETAEPARKIGHSTVTGYARGCCWRICGRFVRIETVAICAAPRRMLPGVEFILDIGGQDMKCCA